MLLTEYNEALHISNEKEISYEEGFLEGELRGQQKEMEDTERERQNAEKERN